MMLLTETQFYSYMETFLDELFQEVPTVATFLGDHRHDDRLGEYTPEALERQRAMLGRWLEEFSSYETQDWSLDAQIDLTLMLQITKQGIRAMDRIRAEHRDPGTVVNECVNGIYMLILRDFAPLPERMRNILGRLHQVPRALSEGRALVNPAEVPPIWAEIALVTTQRSIGLFAGFLPALAQATPELQPQVEAAAQAAAAALQEYVAWIQETVIPQAGGEFAFGEELFNEILSEDHMVDYDAVTLIETGQRLFEETLQQMESLAAQIDPNKSVEQLLEESKKHHPTAEGLLDAYRQKMAETRQFVMDHDIVSIPEGEAIRVEPTPPFLRPLIPYAAYIPPGFLEVLQEGVFIVTPVEEDADPEEAEQKLRGHPWSDIPLTTLHEAYPGHHLQLVFANSLDSLPRKLGGFLSTLFIEGWAFYCEELMERLGFIGEPIQRLARLQAQLQRAARIILDVSLHTGQMTVEEAIDFLIQRVGLEPGDAQAEVLRYTQTPTQPQSYLMGKLQIMEIIKMYRQRYPEASMREMHDAILSCGSLPPRLMRWRLFGEGAV
jgi:uncharacterized protein (DUF885 family)